MQAAAPAPSPQTRDPRSLYLSVLAGLFAVFNSARVLAYLPTLYAIYTSGDSSQHSMITWATFVGANASMAAWLFEHNQRRLNGAVVFNIGNALMCFATIILIAAYRV